MLTFVSLSVWFLAAYRFVNRANSSEGMSIRGGRLTFIKRGLLRTPTQSYDLDKLTQFHYIPKPELTEHPRAGMSMDYFGFQTDQVVINEMFGTITSLLMIMDQPFILVRTGIPGGMKK